MGEVVDVNTLQAEGPSAPYEVDSWDNPRVDEGTVSDGVGLVHEVAEQYRERVPARVVMDTRDVEEGRHSSDFRVTEEGACKTVGVSTTLPLGRKKMEARRRGGTRLTWEDDLGETPTCCGPVRGRFWVESESRGGGGIWEDKGKLPPAWPKGGSCLG